MIPHTPDIFENPLTPKTPSPSSRAPRVRSHPMRRFELHRTRDVSGVSGTGIVAEGIVFSTGTAVVHWISGRFQSTVTWPDGVPAVEEIHGHGGATTIHWIDDA